jgi:hypothetical protein
MIDVILYKDSACLRSGKQAVNPNPITKSKLLDGDQTVHISTMPKHLKHLAQNISHLVSIQRFQAGYCVNCMFSRVRESLFKQNGLNLSHCKVI